MTDIDQALYDAVMADLESDEGTSAEYRRGYHAGVKHAARIAAERVPVAYIGVDTSTPLPPLNDQESAERAAVSDEELAAQIEELIGRHTDGTDWEFDEGMGENVVRAVRAARIAAERVPVSDEELVGRVAYEVSRSSARSYPTDAAVRFADLFTDAQLTVVADAAIAAATPIIRAQVYDELIAEAKGYTFIGPDYEDGPLTTWLWDRKEAEGEH